MNAHRHGPASGTAEPGPPATGAAVASDTAPPPWRDPSLPAAQRAADLLARMTIPEKLAQLGSVWLGGNVAPAAVGLDHDGDGAAVASVAPLQGEFTDGMPPWEELIRDGLGQLTRVFGTKPLPVAEGMRRLAGLQAQISGASRFGIPAIAHEECLTGLAAWTATIFPTPLAWGATFDPDLVEAMAAAIGGSMRALGVHQGLAPVLDVARDPRWGRVEETIGEDPYLVGLIGTAYVRGLQSAGVHATLKHFAGYSASRAGRNMAPVSMGRREFADVILPPFEMAITDGDARCIMHSYADVDGVPPAADEQLLTGLLRAELGFGGVVVADYYGISFLETLHGVAGSPAEAAALALRAGVDMELPNVRCYGAPLADAVLAGQMPEQLIDRAAERVLRQKIELGLLDPGPGRTGDGGNGRPAPDLDPPAHQELAARLAQESVVLLANDGGVLPLRDGTRVAVVGPLAAEPLAFFGAYTFPRHVGHQHPGIGTGVGVSTVLDALASELPQAELQYTAGCEVESPDRSGLAAAVACARAADAVVAVLGDEAGLFGRGSVGEGNDTSDLRLPGIQADLLDELAASGTPVVLVLVTGRPYEIGPVAGRLAAAVQTFFPGQAGGEAIAGVLAGRVVPSGKLPIQLPAAAGQPAGYLHAPLAGPSEVSSADPAPLFPFGHGLSYTSFEYSDLTVTAVGLPGAQDGGAARACITTDGAAEIGCTVRNTGARAGAEVVQLYLRDPVAQVARPVRYLAGFARVPLAPGEARRVVFSLHADRTAFSGLSGARIVEAGDIEVAVGASAADLRLHGGLELHGPQRTVGAGRVLTTPVTIHAA
ncbi:MAG TPA: glycoside hydrolase family 3 N-terminal domain-containing protein [Streptosporangiaceae bacterium]